MTDMDHDMSSLDDAMMLGPYRILEKIADGGMGEVFKAIHVTTGKVVAIKTLSQTLLYDETYIKRLEREANAAAQVMHPNVIRVYLVGASVGRHYITMEYLDGIPLDELLEKKGLVSIEQAVKIIYHAAMGLHAAHKMGVIHRDVKPGNIMLTKNGVVKVMDFGLAKSFDDDTGLTKTGFVMGTPQYMCPDHINLDEVDHRVDIYALGVSFYEILTQQLPYDDSDELVVLQSILNDPLPDPRSFRKDIPEPIVKIIERMMAKKAHMRFLSMKELLNALDRTCAQLGIETPVAQAKRLPSRAVNITRKRKRRHTTQRGMLTGILILTACIAAGLLYWFLAR